MPVRFLYTITSFVQNEYPISDSLKNIIYDIKAVHDSVEVTKYSENGSR